MARTLDSSTVVTLPNLSAGQAHALAQALETAALDAHGKPRRLPETIRAALDEVAADRGKLLAQMGAPPPDDPVVRAADLREDRAVAVLRDVIAAWARLDG